MTIKSTENKEQQAFQESAYFKEKGKELYKIEAKNSEFKHRHGYDVASSSGLICMQMQGCNDYICSQFKMNPNLDERNKVKKNKEKGDFSFKIE